MAMYEAASVGTDALAFTTSDFGEALKHLVDEWRAAEAAKSGKRLSEDIPSTVYLDQSDWKEFGVRVVEFEAAEPVHIGRIVRIK